MTVEQAAPRTFGELLRKHRLAAGLGQEMLAERARLSVETVSALERGARQRPYLETIALLAEALGLSDEDRAGLERAAKRRSLRSLAAVELPRNNLPAQLSTFVGRERDVADVKELLEAHRLVTLVGAGGVGKTRLALALAEQSLSGPHDSVWFVDLSGYADGATLPAAIASGVGLSNATTLDSLLQYLCKQNALLILDNCEHLIEGVSETVAALLAQCADLQIVATTRQAFAIAGERVYRVPPLAFPEIDRDPPTIEEALRYAAIELFVDRASAADSRFKLSERNLRAVAEICRRLDGIALAIELAAARANVFSPETIAERIERHMLSMTGGRRALLSRQRTMHSVLEWSYGLLDDAERWLFRRLSIFAGGFSLDLAAAVSDDSGEPVAVTEILASLVDKSLVQSELLGDVVRYRFLEPTRQYAREKLREAGEERDSARKHALALVELVEHYDSKFELTPDTIWNTRLTPERENYRAAFAWSLSPEGDPRIAQRLAASRTATSFGTGEAAQNWIDAALETCDTATAADVVARLELARARIILVLHGDPNAGLSAAERALALQPQDSRTVAEAELFAGLALVRVGRVAEGELRMRKALAVATSAAPYARTIVLITQTLSTAYAAAGDFAAARESSWESLRLYRAAGCHRLAALHAPNLADFEFADGHVDTALELALESIAFLRQHRVWLELAWALGNASAYFIAANRFDEARANARESLVVAHESGHRMYLILALQHLAAVAALDPGRAGDLQNLSRAANLLGYVDESLAQVRYRREITEQREYDRLLPALRERLGTRLDQLLRTGASWPEDRAMAEALDLP